MGTEVSKPGGKPSPKYPDPTRKEAQRKEIIKKPNHEELHSVL